MVQILHRLVYISNNTELSKRENHWPKPMSLVLMPMIPNLDLIPDLIAVWVKKKAA